MKKIFTSALLLFTLLVIGQNENRDKPFTWDNATVYFVMQDRFENGNTSNDQSYGRGKDGNGNDYGFDEIGAFHGGDFVGLTNKINEGYFDDLGVNAIWFSAPYEQIHGWVSGGPDGGFRHYGYHGYYGLDWTEMDANFGTEDEFRAFVDAAHDHGIRLVMDIVMNHVGYNTLHDMQEYNFGCANDSWRGWRPTNGQNWASIHDLFIDYNCSNWGNWWSGDWVRAGLPGYPAPGGGELTQTLAGLPDIVTESQNQVGLPPILLNKWSSSKLNQEQAELNDFFNRNGYQRTVRNHFVKWLTDWVREFGIDGFRVDTEKHVEGEAWRVLKDQALIALQDWKNNNPSKKLDDSPFWMVGENFGYGYGRSQYHIDSGYDGLINFDFQGQAGNIGNLENVYSNYANTINSASDWNALSYISSHDTSLFNRGNLINGGTSLLLAPGSVQIFYGDETGRPEGPQGGDPHQGTRSYMNWNSIDTNLLNHWQRLGQFRRNHLSVGGGSHQQLSSSPYTFSRSLDNDNVVVVVGASGNTSVNVSSVFPNGTELRDFYTESVATVSNGTVTFNAHSNGIILIEETNPTNRPSLTVSPESSYDPNSITMTASATDKDDPNPTIYYTTDLSLSTDNLSNWTVYSGDVTFTETVDVQIVAQNANEQLSSVANRKYSIGVIDGFTLYAYSECPEPPLVYYWEEVPDVLTDTAWPGVPMAPVGGGCDGWYQYELPGILSTNYIINQCTGQSEDLFLDSQMPAPCIIGNQPPVLTVNPAGGNYDIGDTIQVTLSTTDDGYPNPIIRYTLDGTTPSDSSMVYNEALSISTDTTLRAIAFDSEGLTSNTILETYTFVEPSDGITIYYKGDINNPNIYFWATSPASVTTTWPGENMTDIGNGWYSYTLDGVDCTHLIFSNNGGNQTDDLDRCEDGWYLNGTWYDSNPDDDDDDDDDLTVYFKSDSFNNPEIYFWGATPSGATTSWPGETMTSVGNGWYSYTLTNTDCSNIIFSNNGNSQTADLNRCSEGWYYNGTWYDSNPDDNDDGNDLTIHFKSDSFNNPEIYFWAATPSEATTSWPGETMTNEGNGWYSYTLTNTDCSNMIFSNNGSSQTSDLTRCSNGWYYNGTWYDSDPNVIKNNDVILSEVKIYPNPLTEKSTLAFYAPSKDCKVMIQIINIYGAIQTIYNDQVSQGNHTIDLSEVSSISSTGIYFCRVRINDTIQTKKIINK